MTKNFCKSFDLNKDLLSIGLDHQLFLNKI